MTFIQHLEEKQKRKTNAKSRMKPGFLARRLYTHNLDLWLLLQASNIEYLTNFLDHLSKN